MPGLVRKLVDWVDGKLGIPTRREMQIYCRDWDFTQTNNKHIFDADPNIEEVDEADRLFRINPQLGFLELLALAERGRCGAWILWRGATNMAKASIAT